MCICLMSVNRSIHILYEILFELKCMNKKNLYSAHGISVENLSNSCHGRINQVGNQSIIFFIFKISNTE